MLKIIRFGIVGMAMGLVVIQSAADEKDWPADLRKLVAAERAFAEAADARGIRAAFLEYLTPDAVVFRPRPVLGRPVYEQMPANTTSRLAWQPSFAEVALSGDLGYTTGPWFFKVRRQDPNPTGYGHYVSVWKMSEDGVWKVLLDAGIRHGKYDEWPETVDFPAFLKRPQQTKAGGAGTRSPDTFVALDRGLCRLAVDQNPATAYRHSAAEDLRLLRERALPACGLEKAVRLMPTSASNWIWRPEGQAASMDNSLGYTFGILETRSGSGDNGPAIRYSYLHIWRRIGNQYKLVLDLAVPISDASAQ